MNRKKGFTLIELLVVIAIIALLIGLLLPALAKAQRNARTLKDKAQVKQIHQAFLIFAENNRDKLPTPGLIDRLPDAGGLELPGRGPEDFTANWTAPLYSSMIAQQFFAPPILVGPTEVNPLVRADDDYNYDMYSPANDDYWDIEFTCDVESSGSNTSYAHLALCGQRKKLKWKNSQNSGDPMVATRGTRDGAVTTEEYTKSPTLELHGATKEWVGNVCFNDNHAETINNFYPSQTTYEEKSGTSAPAIDNIFAAEFLDYDPADGEPSNDAFLVICTGSDDLGLTVDQVYDELMN